ncbi:hypothetical protein FNV43_RR04621 [Rhamnella rubrinervis]|uniref:5MP1/2-like HEAT domain-containing protein n=1 Tax=Rhamnella rubrinervis TaxID=2594499 RepID=A0A8K0MQ95_9ROSA|nr:hypothetical protein FNV43_RR04621 [Rhamnella rubrinervis]
MRSSKERPTLGGTRIKTRKRNIAAPLDPAAFADAVVQIYLDNAGDLELVARSIESSDLNFSRYGDTFFEASFLMPGDILCTIKISFFLCSAINSCIHFQKPGERSAFLCNLQVVFTGGRTQPGTTKPDEGSATLTLY